MINIEQTILAQYANSPTIVQLIQNMNDYIDPSADIDNFYNTIWNIDTANRFGLHILARIVNIDPHILASPLEYLDDTALKQLILLKALINISTSSSPAINQLLQNWMAGRGRCYVTDLGHMQIGYVFEFVLQPFEIVILTQGRIFPRPAGVGGTLIVQPAATFGFSEAGTYMVAPFGQAPFAGSMHAIN